MRFKTDRLKTEFGELLQRNPNLSLILQAIDYFCEFRFGKDICLTDVFRTADELKALYANYASPPPDSPHCHWWAADIRSSDFIQSEIDAILSFCNQFKFRGRSVAIYHKIDGNVFHFHIQYA